MTAPPALSVIIPTHNRAATLRRCLDALLAQREDAPDLEIVVVDDGSEDDTAAVVDAVRAGARGVVDYVRQAASGPAAARNRGLRHAHGPLVLFLGDDIIALPRLLREHLAWHVRFPEVTTAVLGLVTWSPDVRITPYMNWLEESGNQFDYGRLQGVEDANPARFLYTANLSFKREMFFATDTFFDERFRHALLEDIDLGRRLAARGLRLKFNPRAAAHHDHAITLASYARRMLLSSEYWLMLEKKRRGGEYDRPDHPVRHAQDTSAPTRRNYLAYAGFLARVSGEVAANYPFWIAARYFETRRNVPTVFTRAHRYWTQRGLLRVEALRARTKLRTFASRHATRVNGGQR